MRLIDADALIDDAFTRYCKDCDRRKGIKKGKWRVIYEVGDAPCRMCDVDDMIDELENAPTVDAEPVRHGRWNKSCRCSECDGWGLTFTDAVSGKYKYCPNCGAKMDEVDDDGET